MGSGRGGPADRGAVPVVRRMRHPARCGTHAMALPGGYSPDAARELLAGCDRRSQRGAVTAEVAVALPALVVLLALVLGTAHLGTVQLRLEEAARAGAREAMRGEGDASVRGTVERLAGQDASVEVTSGAGWTTVEVRSGVEGPVVGLLDLELSASASGKVEHDG